MWRIGSRERVRRGREVRDRERRSGMGRSVRIWRINSEGRFVRWDMVGD